MANRHLARSIVMQTMFQWDFTGWDESTLEETLKYNLEQFAPGVDDTEFIEYLLKGVMRKRAVIDEVIEKAAPDWPLDKINNVDRNIIRLGLFELVFGDYDQVPPKVAINEAIELAKSFGGDSSSRFVNGVLGAVYKELGEPGKDQTGKEDIPLEDMPIHQLAGAVVYTFNSESVYLGMVHDVFGFWTLSKGKVKEGQTPEERVVEAVKEEMGIDVEIKDFLFKNEYIANDPELGKVRKQINYYLTFAEGKPELKLEEGSTGLDGIQWFSPEEVVDLRIYDDVGRLITQSLEKILGGEVD